MAEKQQRRKKGSKNKKKSWQHVNIDDVEEHLDDIRLQERTGGLVEEKSNDQLFFLDIETKDTETEDAVPLKKRRREPKPLRCHANLLPDPKIKPAKISHNIVKPENILKRKSARVLAKQKDGTVSQTQQRADGQRQQHNKQHRLKVKAKRTLPTTTYDLWGDGEKTKTPEIEEHFAKVTRKKKILLPKHALIKPSGVAAVEVPHPGASYNPAYDDHQDLLGKAHQAEYTKVKKELRVTRATDEMFPEASKAPTERHYLDEMSAGLFDEDDDDKVDYTPEELEKLSVNPPIRREDKKTERQRKKDKAKKMQLERALVQKKKNMKRSEEYRLKAIKKEVKERLQELEERAGKKEELKELNKDNTKKLGKMKYEEQDLEVKLSGELQGSLRLLKPEGHLLQDRFKSLQKRNMIEPRLKAKHKRKYKPKVFEKKGHREVTV